MFWKKKKDKDLIPSEFEVSGELINIISMPQKKLFKFNINKLKEFGYTDFKVCNNYDDGYIFARGTMPVCLCAHMDKVPWYKNIKTINRKKILDTNNNVIDVRLSSREGIGGDDRCGVYTIFKMLEAGFKPSVLFCNGEEIGCRGSSKFAIDHDADFLSDINAFIQIDRRGNEDCVKYSDSNMDLTNAICNFGFHPAFGSCTDISVLMPHFGISGVNLSSGYYNEHTGETEYVSVKDLNYLIKRMKNILSSNIFETRYEYKKQEYSWSYSRIKDSNLFDVGSEEDNPEIFYCEYCLESFSADKLIEVMSDEFEFVCEDCAETLIKQGYRRCKSCSNLSDMETLRLHHYDEQTCPFCGCIWDD